MLDQTKADGLKDKPLTDKELEELLRKSDQIQDFPDVTFDEFTPPTRDEWLEACNLLLKGRPFDKVMYTKNYEGITFEPIYTLKDTEAILPTDNYPGMGDFLRGSTVNGYVRQPWGIAQSCDETLPEENNKLLKEEIAKGSTVYNVRLDNATLQGIDVQNAAQPGDVGVNITTIDDMHTMINELDLNKTPVMMYTGASSMTLLPLLAAALKANGTSLKDLQGVIGASPLDELLEHGKTTAPLEVLYDEMAALIKWSQQNAPQLRTIMVKSDVLTNGGAEAVQEIAYSFAMAVDYIRAMQQRGIEIAEIARSIMFVFNQGANFFMEIAKLRAARQVWANIMKAFGAEEKDRAIFVHGRPALFTKAVFDPYVNMLRNTTQAFSSVVGGVNTYENEPFDEPIRKGDVFSRRIARNLHIMLQEEFGMLRPIDAAGGSWAVESLTKQLVDKIWAEFQKIEGMGGALPAIKDGYIQQSIAAVLKERFKALEKRKDRAVGVNMYPNMTEELLDTRPEDHEAMKKQRIAAVDAFRADIDNVFLQTALQELAQGQADAKAELAMTAFTAGATIGEVTQALQHTADALAVQSIEPHRWTERYEAMRMDTENYVKATGKNIEVFLANMGPIPQHKARADFSTSFLQVAEFNVNLNNGFQDDENSTAIEKCVKACAEQPYDVAVICSTDATYPEIVPELAPQLKKVLPENATLFLAGAPPKDMVDAYKAAGIDDFISVSANCYEILRMLQKKKGVIKE